MMEYLWNNNMRHKSVMQAVKALTSILSPENHRLFIEYMGKVEGDSDFSLQHACAKAFVFLTYDVFVGLYEQSNIFISDFLSAAFSKPRF